VAHAYRGVHLTKNRNTLLADLKPRSHHAFKLVGALAAAQLPQAELQRND
jgi:hypothetical protein